MHECCGPLPAANDNASEKRVVRHVDMHKDAKHTHTTCAFTHGDAAYLALGVHNLSVKLAPALHVSVVGKQLLSAKHAA